MNSRKSAQIGLALGTLLMVLFAVCAFMPTYPAGAKECLNVTALPLAVLMIGFSFVELLRHRRQERRLAR